MKPIKLSEYVAIIKPTYVYLRLTPNNAIRNNTSSNIAKTIGSLFKTLRQIIKTERKKLIKAMGKKLLGTKFSVALNPKVSYYIYVEKKRIEFYFIVPKQYESIIREKMSDTWDSVTIKPVDELPSFSEDSTIYQLAYSKEDGLSLAVDKRSNKLLESNMNIVDIMEDGDKVGIFYNFIPTSQRSWLSEYRSTITKVRMEQPVDKNKAGPKYLAKWAFSLLSGLLNDVGQVLGGDGKYIAKYEKDNAMILKQTLSSISNHKVVSDATVIKGKNMVLKAQIIVLSESRDELRQRNNAKSLAQSYDCIGGEDNSLLHRKYKGRFNHLDTKVKGAEVLKVGVDECSNFLALPGRELLAKHKFIEKIETLESEVPDELLTGVMCLGENTFKGNKQKVYMSTDFDYQMLSLVLIGPNRAGKSKFLANIARDAIKAGECVIIPDFIGSCQLSDEIASAFSKDKVLEVRCDNWETLQGLAYNEVPPSTNPFIQYKNAKEQSALLMTLVDSINADDASFTAKMGRYFESAALVVFLSNGNIKDVFATLLNYKVRKAFIDVVSKEQMENMEEYIDYLRELDEVDKKGKVVGTKTHLITGAVDRLQKLKVNAYIETMLKKGSENNIDLVQEIQRNQLIVIKMPQRMFLTDNEKDVYVTYWMTKIWLALQIREEQVKERSKMTKVNLIIDDLYQVNNAEKFLKLKLSQLPKFNLKPIISCHYLNQVKSIREEFRSANASYMLISGCDKKNFDELKSELYPYTEEDLLSLKRYHSLNLIKCNDNYAKFVTHLPAPITHHQGGDERNAAE